MKFRIAIVLATLAVAPAAAQQPDPAFMQAYMQKSIIALQQQRNAALDGQAQSQAQAAMQTDEIAKLKARIAELEKAAAESNPPTVADPAK